MVMGSALAALAAVTIAAVPQQVAIQGLLTSGAGQPATDGAYTLVVGVYGSSSASVPPCKEVFNESVKFRRRGGSIARLRPRGSDHATPCPGFFRAPRDGCFVRL
jgi:hypothetical protein